MSPGAGNVTGEPRPLRDGDPRRIGGYRLTGVLGEGGQGVVYLSRISLDRPVAVKTLHARLADDAEARERFLRESEITRRVAAFCTARVLDAGVEDGRPYLVSEYVRGPSLDALVATDGPRTGGGLDRLAITTLTALQAIHRAGVVHRDLKPSNVLMGPEGPVVIDFGIARMLEHSTTASSGLVGTPPYMAPELLGGAPAGPASDVFAWAATLVYAATGHRAFPGTLAAVVLNAIMTREPDLGGVPGRLRPLLAACLAKDPAARPGVADLLTALTHERPLPAPPKAVGRRRLARAVAAAVAAAAIPAGYGLTDLFSAPAGIPFGSPVRAPVAGGQQWVLSVVTARLDGRPVVVSGGYDGTVAVADLATGAPVGAPLKGHRGPVWSVTASELDGRRVAVSGGLDGTVRVWDLATGAPVREPLTGHRGSVESVAAGDLGGRPVAVSGGLDTEVRAWDLASGAPLGRPFTGHADWVLAVAVGRLGGRPVVASGDHAGTILVSDLATGVRVAGPARGHRGPVESIAVGRLGDRPVIVSGGGDGDHTVRVWDLASAAPIGRPLAGHRSWALGLAVGELDDGRAVAVSGGYRDGAVRVWDLAAGRPLGGPLLGHRGLIETVAVGALDDRAVAVSGGDDGSIRVWSLGPPYPPD
ncbi:serine/threonine protein kinase [Actinomadura sp. ATCC 31491]|uniref:Serine/threonine protein kinase n=1 Tax=Actinomadura luzonensis TaxID=2805427 RepID=A0ABT0FU50_9ACTN|nr:serine/threonine-protein kinase [Actinomadura luzonensis]MCK2215867.1 serine/threonine protein kinase [Actinomadura luzonensis]